MQIQMQEDDKFNHKSKLCIIAIMTDSVLLLPSFAWTTSFSIRRLAGITYSAQTHTSTIPQARASWTRPSRSSSA
jgi:hypothetical protein